MSNCIAQSNSSTNFTLEGKVIGRDTGKIILAYVKENNAIIKDTVLLKNGSFGFTGNIRAATFATVSGDVKTPWLNDPNYVRIFIEPKHMTATLTENDFKHPKITGSLTQNEFDTVNKNLDVILKKEQPIDSRLNSLNHKWDHGDHSEMMKDSLKLIRRQLKPFLHERDEVIYKYILMHHESELSAGLIVYYVLPKKLTPDSISMLYNSLSTQIKSTPLGIEAYKSIQSYLPEGSSRIGNAAPAFSLKDINNKTLNLSDFTNKDYVLLDFWATWCVPCKAFMPHLSDIYRDFHHKGLEVISISIDQQKESWLRDSPKENFKWYNVYIGSNPMELRQKYGVEAVPTIILIDKKGKIIGKYKGTDENGDIAQLEDQIRKLL
jgi:peroxiredoxin